MERYETYKPSQIPWLHDIPVHWERKTLSQLTSEHKLSNKGVNHQNLLSLSYGRIVRKDINKTDGLLPASFEGYQIIEPGNIVLRLTDLQNDHKSLRVGLCKEEGIITSAYVAIDVKPFINSEYLYLLLHSYDIKKVFYSMGDGIRQGLNYQGLSKIGVLLPPIDEQKQIVEFLSRKTALIEKLQQEREREIQLLNELKQAEIANVVTRGLNPETPFKSVHTLLSEEIPSDWNLIRMRNLVREQIELVGDRKTFPLLSLTKGGVILRDVESGKGKFPKDFQKYKVVVPDDIIFCLFDIDETPRTVGLSSYHGMITGAYDVFSINEKIVNKEFLYYYFLAVDNIKALRPFYTGLRKVVQGPIFLSLQIPVPPIEEQKAIVEYIENKTKAIDDMIANLRSEIDFLTEYKQRLIADVVTGQIDVRNL